MLHPAPLADTHRLKVRLKECKKSIRIGSLIAATDLDFDLIALLYAELHKRHKLLSVSLLAVCKNLNVRIILLYLFYKVSSRTSMDTNRISNDILK